MMDVNMKWIKQLRDFKDERPSLLFFPPAGGGSFFFRPFLKENPSQWSLFSVVLPGREHLMNVEYPKTMADLTSHLAAEICQVFSKSQKLFFFGHSFGSLVAYNTVLKLQEQRQRLPDLLIVSAHCSPDKNTPIGPIHEFSDSKMIEQIQSFDGIPTEVESDSDYLKMVTDWIRMDLRLDYETKSCKPIPVKMPILSLSASNDHVAPLDYMWNWNNLSKSKTKMIVVDGSHNHLVGNEKMVMGLINHEVKTNILF